MNIIIAGDGEVGFYLAKLLTEYNHSITVVDPNAELLKMLESEADLLSITGDSTSISVLKEANIANADLLIAVLHEETINLLTCIIGKKMGAKRTVARVSSMEYLHERNIALFKSLGIDELVAPEMIAAQEIVALLNQSAATEVHNFSDGKLQMLLFRLEPEAPVTGMTLAEVAQKFPDLNFRAVAIHRRGRTLIPSAFDKFLPNDLACVLSKPTGLDLLMELSGKKSYSIKNVMIIGAGRIGKETAKGIQAEKNVKIIEIDKQRCEETAVELNRTLIINGDAHNAQLLEDERITQMDAFIAVTQDHGINMFACLLAQKYGVKKVIPLIDNIDYIDIAQNIGIDIAINRKLITASYIARFTMNSVASITYLSSIEADVLEFNVKEGMPITKRPLKKIRMPQGSIIGGYIRQERGYIAIGETVFLQGDTVLVLTLPYAISKVEKLFS
jgi:trk system potassium uptake protein TrkA